MPELIHKKLSEILEKMEEAELLLCSRSFPDESRNGQALIVIRNKAAILCQHLQSSWADRHESCEEPSIIVRFGWGVLAFLTFLGAVSLFFLACSLLNLTGSYSITPRAVLFGAFVCGLVWFIKSKNFKR
jgi:hypothetical protein